MSSGESDSGEQEIEGGVNPTQQRMDEEGTDGSPVDVGWEGEAPDADNEASPHQGEEGQSIA